jgi:ABC-type transporter Mla subunit MlaD
VSLKAHYFRVGLFVLVGMALIVGAIIAFGVGAVMEEEYYYAETYFEESVQGLEVGSPVKLLGVQIGRVETITFVDQIYDVDPAIVHSRPVLIRAALFPQALKAKSKKEFEELGPKFVEAGMRIRLASQGFTGVRYLDAGMLDPQRFPAMEIDWEPEVLYIPSARGQLSAIVDSVDALTQKLEEIPFQRLTEGAEVLVQTLQQGVRDADIATLSSKLGQVLDNVVDVTGPELHDTRDRIDRLIDRLNTIASDVEVAEAMRNFDRTMAAVKDATTALPGTIRRLDSAIADVESLLSGEEETLRLMLHDMRIAVQNLRAFTDTLKRYPTAVLFGKEPPAVDPEEAGDGGPR